MNAKAREAHTATLQANSYLENDLTGLQSESFLH